MNLKQAMQSAVEGNFVTNEYFNPGEFMLYYNNKFYYDDGGFVNTDFLQGEEFALKGKWSVIVPKDKVNWRKVVEICNKPALIEKRKFESCILE